MQDFCDFVEEHGQLWCNMSSGPLCDRKNTAVGLQGFNPFKPEFIIVIFIHYKPRIAVAILDL